jgi:undecaprenyl-diphosphatase
VTAGTTGQRSHPDPLGSQAPTVEAVTAPVRDDVLLLFQALVLGLLQGLTEFLPVSSSGHLQGVPFLLGWEAGGNLAFDVMVHAGTLVAVVVYFREELRQLLRGVVGAEGVTPTERRRAWTLLGLLALGTVPAAASGVLFEDVFAAAFGSPRAVAGFLYLTAVLLWGSERIRAARIRGAGAAVVGVDADRRETTAAELLSDDIGRDTTRLTVRDAIVIGAAQALAIFPGVSRSGATIAAGMALGLSRAAAARFSFLLSIPIITGALVYEARNLGAVEPGTLPFGPLEIGVGVLAAAVSGYWAISFLIRLLERRDLLVFARYVAVFATVVLVATFVRG